MPLDEFTHYFSESKISTKQRKKLDDSQFGIPSLRKYPLTDEKHVLQAVRFFNKAPEEHKPELARNIVKRAKELNMDWEKWDVLKPYLDKPVKEAYAKELHSTPEADKICAYLCKSVKYDNASPKTWRLKSPDEVTDHNKGNCHDTAWYVFNNLDAYAKRKVGKGILFFIEYKEGKNEGGQTHSVCYEKIPGGICIIECSWEGMTGTFPYNDINEYISVVKNNWKFTGDNDKLYATEIKNTSQIHPGMTLSEYVFVAMKNKEIITESYGPDPDDGDHTSGTSDFDHDDNDPDDCYCESGNDASETQAFYKRWFDNKAKEDLKLAKDIAKRIHEKYEADQQPPCGNQNCMLCTMCAEAQFRGINVLPRPVYSPRDPVLNILGESIVKNPKHKSIKTGFDDMLDLATEPKDARWYCHVKWKNGHGGHEFLLLNINKHLYVMDPQQEIVTLNIESTYFNDVDYNESYICRLDKCELDEALLNKMNDPSQIVPWDAKLDIPYMLKEGMLSEEEAEQYWKEHPDERPNDRHFLSYKELDKMSESKNIFTSGDFAKYGKDVDLTDARGPIQESAWQDIKNGVNPFSKNLVFHISKNGALDGQIFKPRVPEYITKYDSTDPKFEDNTTGRICFSPSIEGCLNAILVNIGRWKTADKLGDWYVYMPEKPLNEYKYSSNRDIIKGKKVYDANLTKEIWIEEPVRLKQYGVIHVDQVKASDRKKTVATSDNVKGDRRYYTFKWHWLVKPKVLKDIPYDYSKHETCENLEEELWRFGYGLIKGGKLMKGNVSEKDWYKYWRLADPEEFEQAKGGNCYDYVEWESGYLDAFGHECNKIFIKSSTGNNHAFIYVKDESKYIFIDGAFNKIDKKTHIMKEFDSLDKCFKYITDAIKKYEKNDSISFTFYDYTKEDMKPGTPMKEFEEWIISHGKTVNINKPIKEEYIMSDFERDPSVLQMILEAEAEENDEKGSNDDEKGDAIESTEISIEGESEIGSDVGDVQNEYNPEEVERLNKLINSEMSAVSEYFNAAKESKEPNLMRLYSDIGDEERFHLEQLIYAKSTITGEAYEPQDPKVKKEYQELLDMGMDEETAMTTAVDKVQLMPKEAMEDMSEDEAADFEESFRLISTSSLQTAVMLEAAIDTSDIALQISENSTAFLEQMIIMEEVDNLNTRQGQKDLGSKNPIVILIKAFVAIYGAIIGLARKARLAFQKIRLRDKRKWAWIKKHGIGAIFAKGVSFYFFSEKKNMYDVGEPMRYIGLIHSMNEAIIKSCNITTVSPKKYDIDGYITKLTDTAKGTNREIQITPIAARNTEDGIRLLQGVSLMKTKVVLTQENTPILEEQFFGYTAKNYAMIEKEGENTKNIKLSINVYNQMSILLDALAALGSETKLVMEALNNQEGTQGTTYDKMPGVWKSAVRAISVMEKSVSKFNSAVAADVSEMIKVNNGLKEAMETADTTGDTSAVTQHKNDVAQQQKANAEESKKNAEANDTVATTRKMATR